MSDEDPSPGRQLGDDGSGTVLAVGLVAVLAMLVLATTTLGAAVVARHRAATAADLAALAAADRTTGRASGPACLAAREVAATNNAALTGCTVDPDGSVTVTVQVSLPGSLRRLGSASARARAGRPPSPGASTAEGQPTVMASSRRLMKSEARTAG